MNSGVGLRLVLDPALLWLWCRPAAAAPIQPLAWEPPYAMALTLKGKKQKQENRHKQMKRVRHERVPMTKCPCHQEKSHCCCIRVFHQPGTLTWDPWASVLLVFRHHRYGWWNCWPCGWTPPPMLNPSTEVRGWADITPSHVPNL